MAAKCPKCGSVFKRSQALGGHLWHVHGIRARRPGEEETLNPASVPLAIEVQDARGRPMKRFQVHTLDPEGLIEAVRKTLVSFLKK